MTTEALIAEARAVLAKADKAKLTIATAESCTGGLVAATITAVPGCSSVFERGLVTYSNESKTEMLGVPSALIEAHGAVSEEVARAMAEGAIENSRAEVTVSITGIAGPDGGSEDKPVGLVHFAAARRGGRTLHEVKRFGNIGRREVQEASVLAALKLLGRAIG